MLWANLRLFLEAVVWNQAKMASQAPDFIKLVSQRSPSSDVDDEDCDDSAMAELVQHDVCCIGICFNLVIFYLNENI